MSREWIEEAESCGSIVQIYYNQRILFCAIGDAIPHEIFYDPKVGVNLMSKALENHISTEQPLTFSCKHLKWIDGQIMESQEILRVVPILMGNNKGLPRLPHLRYLGR